MRRICLAVLVCSMLLCSGCWRRWVGPTMQMPIIPMEEYPEYEVPSDIQTEEDKAKVVDALFKAEKHAMVLRERIKIYNIFAKGNNRQAKDLFK